MFELWKLYHINTSVTDSYTPLPSAASYGSPRHGRYISISEETFPLGDDIDELLNNSELCKIIVRRQSRRTYSSDPICLNKIINIIRFSYGARTLFAPSAEGNVCPSAGARYPIELNFFSLNILGQNPGTYHYNQDKDILEKTSKTNYNGKLYYYCNQQEFINKAAVVIALCANFDSTISKYGERGYRYVYLDAGHIAQNVYLICEKLNLGCCGIGGFYDNDIRQALKLPFGVWPIYLIAVGNI